MNYIILEVAHWQNEPNVGRSATEVYYRRVLSTAAGLQNEPIWSSYRPQWFALATLFDASALFTLEGIAGKDDLDAPDPCSESDGSDGDGPAGEAHR
jgi:hypothetical protein